MELAKAATVNFVQSLAATEVKAIADRLGDTTREPVRAALQSLVACGGATARGQDCGNAALGAASAVIINATLTDPANLTATERQARENLLTTLIAGGAAASGSADMANITTAAQLETQNNNLLVEGAVIVVVAALVTLTVIAQKLNQSDQAASDASVNNTLGKIPDPTPRHTAAEYEQARQDLTQKLKDYGYLLKTSPDYAPGALERAKQMAEKYGYTLEQFEGGIRIATGTPGFPADPGIKIPGKQETPISQPGKNDGRYATPITEQNYKERVEPGYAEGDKPNLSNTTTSLVEQKGWQDSVYLSENAESSSDFNHARNAALEWLESRGFRAEQPTVGKFGDNAEKPIGMKTSDGRIGFRIEYDDRNGA